MRTQKIITTAALLSLFIGQAAPAFAFNPNYLISDEELTDVFSMDLSQIEAVLAKGSLAEYRTEDIDGRTRYASDIIWRAAQRNGISPQVILVMLQKEQSLVTDTSPSSSQLDWAMGYAVCDACSHDDPEIQRFRGFAKQINSATLQLTEGYLLDLETEGETVMGFAPGETVRIDGEYVTPANNATAALYTYTPHLHGNQNFVTIWHRWFTKDYPSGSLLQNTDDGAVWLIKYGERRPITSRTAFTTRFRDEAIIPVPPSALEAYPIGSPISLANYSLLETEDGDIYLLVDDEVRHIVSMEAFRAIGFNTDDLVAITDEELLSYEEGTPISADTVYPQGALLQDPNSGGVFYVENGVKYPLLSREILEARYGTRSIQSTTVAELESYDTGTPVGFADGTLIGITGAPAVYVISEGERRPIPSEAVFLSFGWNWDQVFWTNQRAADLHPIGDPIEAANPGEEIISYEVEISSTP